MIFIISLNFIIAASVFAILRARNSRESDDCLSACDIDIIE